MNLILIFEDVIKVFAYFVIFEFMAFLVVRESNYFNVELQERELVEVQVLVEVVED